MYAGTIVARNYLAQARVLALSFLEHHPDWQFEILVVDGDAGTGDDLRGFPVTVVSPAHIGLPADEWQEMAAGYTVLEFATALKPAFLKHLLGERPAEDSVALYLDPDIYVYRMFGEVADAARRTGIALTPHVLHPLPRDGHEPSEAALMHAGLFNLGFVAVGSKGVEFLDWWCERVRYDAAVDLPNALFTDQRWVDWVPSLFPAEVLRDHGLNVAYWNLHERPLKREGSCILAGGEPLRFLHFSGYDPDTPWLLSKHAPNRPRVRLLESALLVEQCHRCGERLRAEGLDTYRKTPYGLATAANGTALTPSVRSTYRLAVRDAHRDGTPPPPSPFAADGGDAFARWLIEPFVGSPRLDLGRWHIQVWKSRMDLQGAFPDIEGADAWRLHRWFEDDPDGRALFEDVYIPRRLCGPDRPRLEVQVADRHERLSYGWNVIGYFTSELGVGEAGRLVNLAAETAGIPTNLVSIKAVASRQAHRWNRPATDALIYENSLYCVNADQTLRVMSIVGDPRRANRPGGQRGRRIGLWFWEVDEFPAAWAPVAEEMDVIWCASSYTADAISAVSSTPVQVVPLPVCPPTAPTPFTRRLLGLPGGFVFLFSYDFNSVMARKNPLDLIDAYTRAFGPDDGASLVVKSINGSAHAERLDRVRYAANSRPDIRIVDGYVDSNEMQGLIELSDCFVSLHRSEGFGLQLATAMASGRPVIATGYSGNMDYMG